MDFEVPRDTEATSELLFVSELRVSQLALLKIFWSSSFFSVRSNTVLVCNYV